MKGMRTFGLSAPSLAHVGRWTIRKRPKSKLTEEQAREIFERVKNGEPRKALAIEFQVNVSSIAQIALGERKMAPKCQK